MTLEIIDFVQETEGVELSDFPPRVQERVNDALADLTGGEDGPGNDPGDTPQSIVVDKDPGEGDFDSIQAAIDDSGTEAGDVIFVEPGTYDETVVIDKKKLTLTSTQGSGQTTIGDPSGPSLAGPILRINAEDVIVDGFEIAGADGNNETGQGVDVNGDDHNTDGVELRNLEVRNNDDRGLVVDYTENATIENVVVEDNYDRDNQSGDPPEDGFGSPDDADGITLWFTNNSTLSNVTARRNGDNGIYIKGTNNTLEDITVDANADEGLDLSSDGNPDGGATVTNLTTKGNSAQEVEIEGHANDVTIEDSEISIDANGDSGGVQPAGISVPEMDGGTVSISNTDFNFDDSKKDTLAYVSDSAGAVDFDATVNDNTFAETPVEADLDDDRTSDALVPSRAKFVSSGANRFDFSGDDSFDVDVVTASDPAGSGDVAHVTSGGTATKDYATTAIEFSSPPTLGDLTNGSTLTYDYYGGPNNETSAPDEVYLLIAEDDGTRHVLYRTSNDGDPDAEQWQTRNVHKEIAGNPENNQGFNWSEIKSDGTTDNIGNGGPTSDLSNVYSDDAELLAMAAGRGTIGNDDVSDIYYKNPELDGSSVGSFPTF